MTSDPLGPPLLGPVVCYDGDPADTGVCLSWSGGHEEVWWSDGCVDVVEPRNPRAVRVVCGHNGVRAPVVSRRRKDALALLIHSWRAACDLLNEPWRPPMTSDPLRALTLHRVWAGMVALGWKPYEFRNSRPLACIGQRVAIHAGLKVGDVAAFRLLVRQLRSGASDDTIDHHLGWCLEDAPPGHIIATALVGEPIDLHGKRYNKALALQHLPPGYEGARWAIPLLDVRRLSEPVPCRGSVTLGWRVPDDVAELVREREVRHG